MAFVLHWITWTGFIRDEALIPVFENYDSNNTSIKENSENKNTLKFNTENEHYKALILLFEKDEIFLEPDLSLYVLSKKLGISKSYLSALINKTTNKNFYNFVNSYRTEYLISLFKEKKNKDFTILSLAYDAGFNSKSTFQSFFKKNKGKTPSQYIKSLERNEVAA